MNRFLLINMFFLIFFIIGVVRKKVILKIKCNIKIWYESLRRFEYLLGVLVIKIELLFWVILVMILVLLNLLV